MQNWKKILIKTNTIKQTLEYAEAPKKHILISGHSKSGKTTLLNIIRYNFKEKNIFYFYVSCLDCKNIDDIALRIRQLLNDKGYYHEEGKTKQISSFNEFIELDNSMKQKILILLDDFHKLEETQNLQKVYNSIKTLKNIYFVFTVLPSFVQQSFKFDNIKRIQMSPFTKNEAKRFIEEIMPDKFQNESKQLNQTYLNTIKQYIPFMRGKPTQSQPCIDIEYILSYSGYHVFIIKMMICELIIHDKFGEQPLSFYFKIYKKLQFNNFFSKIIEEMSIDIRQIKLQMDEQNCNNSDTADFKCLRQNGLLNENNKPFLYFNYWLSEMKK